MELQHLRFYDPSYCEGSVRRSGFREVTYDYIYTVSNIKSVNDKNKHMPRQPYKVCFTFSHVTIFLTAINICLPLRKR